MLIRLTALDLHRFSSAGILHIFCLISSGFRWGVPALLVL
jgi:hypothetical protein